MNPRRAIGVFLNRTAGPMITYILRTRIAPSESQIERELAVKYGKIADHMMDRERLGKGWPCPVENPAFAARVVREVFEETRKEIGGKHEMTEERKNEITQKVKTKVMGKLGLDQKR